MASLERLVVFLLGVTVVAGGNYSSYSPYPSYPPHSPSPKPRPPSPPPPSPPPPPTPKAPESPMPPPPSPPGSPTPPPPTSPTPTPPTPSAPAPAADRALPPSTVEVPAQAPEPPPECRLQPGIQLDGTELGTETLELETADECCQACRGAESNGSSSAACNTFTYCPTDSNPSECPPGMCVLKFSQEVPAPVQSVNVWTSGTNCAPSLEDCVVEEEECPFQTGTRRSQPGSTFNDAGLLIVETPQDCCSLCRRTPGCRSWACDGRNAGCALKMTVPQQVAVPEGVAFFSGVVDPAGVSDTVLDEVLPASTPCAIEDNTEFPGNDVEVLMSDSPDQCCRMCENHVDAEGIADCFAWTRNKQTGECSIKNRISERVNNPMVVGATAF